jgi:hypothetical protein
MRRPFLMGKKIYLRLLEESDVSEEYVGWLDDYEVTRYLEKVPSYQRRKRFTSIWIDFKIVTWTSSLRLLAKILISTSAIFLLTA